MVSNKVLQDNQLGRAMAVDLRKFFQPTDPGKALAVHNPEDNRSTRRCEEYEVERATAPWIGVWSKPKSSKSSVTVVVNVDEVLAAKPSDRARLLKEIASCEIAGKALNLRKKPSINPPDSICSVTGEHID